MNQEKNYPYVHIQDGFWMIKFCEKIQNIPTDFHYHDAMELYFLIDGKCKFFIDDSIYEIKPGDLAIIPPNVLHKAYYEKDTPITRFVMNAEISLLSEKSNEVLLSSGYHVKRLKVAIGEVEEIFRKIKKESDNTDDISAELVKSYLTSVAALIFRNPKDKDSIEIKSKSRFVEAAITYLKSNYSNNISLDDVARYVSVSYIHLSRTFKAETGFGLNEYLNLYRLRQAKFMLAECPSKSISEIAYDCGFNDSNYFAVKFKNIFGITPTQFRNGEVAVENRSFFAE